MHLNWRLHHDELKNLEIPMLSDIKRELIESCGVMSQQAGAAYRATFVVDPQGIIRHVSVNDLSVGRNPQEILRILDGLQSDELCPCNWNKGDAFIKHDARCVCACAGSFPCRAHTPHITLPPRTPPFPARTAT